MVEALACRSSLNNAISLGLRSLRVFSDNQMLIRAINDGILDKEIFGIVADIMNISESFVSISLAFILGEKLSR